MQYNAQQIYKQVILNIQQQKALEIDSGEFQNIIKRQNNQKLNINGDKISGAVDLQTVGVNNLAKVEGIKLAAGNDVKVRFIAVEDDKTTLMCDSLNNKIFNVHKENVFDRYYGETQKELRLQRIRCNGLVLGLNLPPIQWHFHYCRSTIMYLPPVENQEKTEYNIPKYLRVSVEKFYKDSIKDFKTIQTEYDMLPENVRNKLEKSNVIIVLNPNMPYSGYDFNAKKIILLPNLEKGEFIHEIGHALEYLDNVIESEKYKNIVKDILNKNTLQLKNDKNIPYIGLLNEDKGISSYQTFVGFNETQASKNLKNLRLPELISEAYRAYYFEKDKLKANNKKLFEFIEEIEKNA